MSIETTLIRDGGQELEGLWQFDLGQTFTVLTGEVDVDLTDCEIQWVYGTLEPPNYTDNRPFTAIDGTALTVGGLCEIPDSALEQSGEVKGYIVYKDGSTVLETLGMVYFTPETRARPADYVSPDNTVTLEVLIDERIAQSGAGILTVEKFSDLPENGTIALVQNDEVITQAQSDFDAETEYSLFVNPQIPLDVDFEVAFIQSEPTYDNGEITLTLNTTELSHPVFTTEARITDGQIVTVKQWYYAENEIIVDDLTILKGWSSVDTVNGVITKNESISYTDLPNLDGTFVEANSLGGTYFLETPYSVNKSGLYNYDTDLEKWVRVDGDSSLWCEAAGFLAKAGGYGNSAPGDGAFIGGGSGNSAPGQLAFIGGGSGNSAPGQLAFVGGGSGNSATSQLAFVGGGTGNSAPGQLAFVGGGRGNNVGAQYGAIGGGRGNNVGAQYGAIGGGTGNNVGAYAGAIGGGTGNNVDGEYGAIGGGTGNSITSTGARAFIGAGQNLIASAPDSAIFGRNGETDTDTLFAVAIGTSIDNKSLALNIESTQATWTIPVIGLTASSGDNSTKLATTAFVQGEISTKELKSNKVTTIDANSTDEEYPSAKAVFDFVPEIDVGELVPTMTEYATVLTLNKGNYWTTTASIEFALPTAVSGKKNTFTLFVKVTDAGHAVTFSPSGSQRLGAVAHTFGVGTHLVEGVYNPIDSKWLLGCSAVGVPA